MGSSNLPDESAGRYDKYDEEKFVRTREAIMTMLPTLFKSGSSRWSSYEVLESLIDGTVAEICDTWMEKTNE